MRLKSFCSIIDVLSPGCRTFLILRPQRQEQTPEVVLFINGPQVLHLGLFSVDSDTDDKGTLLLVPEASKIKKHARFDPSPQLASNPVAGLAFTLPAH